MRITVPVVAAVLFLPATLDAQFSAAIPIARSQMSQPQRVRAWDVDLDGDRDLIVASSASLTFAHGSYCQLALLRNDGAGAFGGMEVLDSTASDIQEFVLADLDEDGDSDIVATSKTITFTYEGKTFWYENLGGGAFGPSQTITDEELHQGTLAVCDLDGDGDMDVVDAGGGLFWHENNGDGTFTNTHDIENSGLVTTVTMADLDNDGDFDAVFGKSNEQEVFAKINDGAGVFTGGYIIFEGAFSGYQVTSTIGRLNTGSTPDLVTCPLLGGALITHLYQSDLAYTLTDTVDLNARLFELADIDNDGRLDMLGSAQGEGVGWWRNLNNGLFSAFSPFIPNRSFYEDGEWVDLNNDGAPDLVHAAGYSDQVNVYLNDGGNAFWSGSDLLYAISEMRTIALADMDGDGDRDPIYPADAPNRVAWRANNGSGNMGPEQSMGALPANASSVEMVDLEPDGDLDAVVSTSGHLLTFINDGQGSTAIATTVLTSYVCFSMGDQDGDGDQDLLVANTADSTIRWWANSANTFTPGTVISDEVAYVSRVRCGDLNGDGAVDVAITAGNPDSLIVTLNDGNGNFPAPAHYQPIEDGSFTELFMEDLDMDGDRDLVVINSYELVLYDNPGAGVFGAPVHIAYVNGGAELTRLTDVDADGDLDIVLGGYMGMTLEHLHWMENLGSLQFGGAITVPTAVKGETAVATGDINGDGLPDILTASAHDDRLDWYANHIDQTVPVSGHAFLDLDSNGVAGSDDPALSYQPVWTSPDVGTIYTGSDGDFQFYLFNGEHELGMEEPGAAWALSTDSTSYQLSISTGSSPISDIVFGFRPVGPVPVLDIAVSMNGDGCDVDRSMAISIHNTGPVTAHGAIHLDLDPMFSFSSSTTPQDSVVGGNVYWSYAALQPGQSTSLYSFIHTPGVDQLNTEYDHLLEVSAISQLGADSLFTITHEGTVSCGYDPNAKQVSPSGIGQMGYVDINQSHLTYTIHFQNTGNDTAHTVVLRDELDHRLIHSSLEVIATTHPFVLEVEADGEAVFTFENINLPDSGTDQLGSQGHVVLRMALEEGLPSGTLITNTAGIYFDNNPAVTTNTVNTTLRDCSLFQPWVIEEPPFVLNTVLDALSYQWYLDDEAITGGTGPAWFAQADGDYTVIVTDTTGCTTTAGPYAIIGSGIRDNDAVRMTARPNPFVDRCEVVFSEPVGTEATLALMDVTGRTQRLVRGTGTRSITIDRGSLAAGIYHARLIEHGSLGAGLHLVIR